MAYFNTLDEMKDFARVTYKWPVTWTGGVYPAGPCWIWNRSLHNGYGKITWDYGGGKYYTTTAHRIAFALRHGSFSENETAHKCNNKPCFNPWHLEDKTSLDNSLDKRVHGTAKYPQRRSHWPRVSWRGGDDSWQGEVHFRGHRFSKQSKDEWLAFSGTAQKLLDSHPNILLIADRGSGAYAVAATYLQEKARVAA